MFITDFAGQLILERLARLHYGYHQSKVYTNDTTGNQHSFEEFRFPGQYRRYLDKCEHQGEEGRHHRHRRQFEQCELPSNIRPEAD